MFDAIENMKLKVKNLAFNNITKTASLVFMTSALALPAALLPTAATAAPTPTSFADLVETLQPSVVNISSTQKAKTRGSDDDFEKMFKDFFDRRRGVTPDSEDKSDRKDKPKQASSLGSGFIIAETGLVVTNNHVIDGADEITVRLFDDTEYKATLVGRDKRTDLAVLQMQDVEGTLPATKWGSSGELRIGDWMIAIGNPFGFGGTVTAGIVSAKQREISGDPYDSFIQTDAAINRGNSGGPSFNIKGEVIGVNTAIISPTGGSVGIGFAIPSDLASKIVSQLIEYGEVKRGWLGVRIQEVTEDLALGLKLDEPRGALVASAQPDGPADRSGIKAGDVILTFNGKIVPEMRKLPLMVAETAIGEVAKVTVWRDGEEIALDVKLGDLEDADTRVAAARDEPQTSEESALTELGLTLSNIDEDMRTELGLKENEGGVLITEVAEGSAFDKKDVKAGDVIIEVDQTKVTTSEEVAGLIDTAKADNFQVATLLIFREGDYRWVAVRIVD